MAQQDINNGESGASARGKINSQTQELYTLMSGKASTGYVDSAIATEVVNRNAAIAAALVGLVDYRGGFDASVNAYPSSGGSGTAGAILKADFWIVTVAGTLPTGIPVAPGDWIFAKIDTPGNTQANWDVVETNFGFTPENVANKDTDGTLAANSDTKYPSQKAAKTYNDVAIATEVTNRNAAITAAGLNKVSITGAELHATATGTNTYAATLSPTPAYASGLTVRLKFTNANTGASTINLNSLGAKAIKKNASVDLASGDIPAGGIVELVYDGTNFQAIGILTSVGATWGAIGGTLASQSDLATALANKVDETDWVTLTDGATTTWDTTNLQNPIAKWTMGATTRTLAMTNLKSGASGLLVVKTGVSGAITVTFPSGSVTDNGTLTTYTFPAGINVFYDLSWYYDSATTTIKWLIGVSNIDTDQTMAANSDLLVASQRATKAADDANLNTALSYTDTSIQFIPWKNIVDAATVSALPANTAGSNVNGVYQLLTANANGAFPSIDGAGGGTKFLIKDEADQKKNGKYDLIDAGSGSTPWILRRSTDFDASNKIRAAILRVLNGSVNAGKFFKQDTPSVTIGTNNIVFSEFGSTTSNTSQFALVQSMRNFYGY